MKVTTTDVLGNTYEAEADSLKLGAHVYGIAVQDGKVLVVPQYGGYDYPGGTMELGETHLETLVREFKEETGFDIQPLRLLNVYSSFFHHSRYNKDYQSILIFYTVEIIGGELSTEGFDRDEKVYASEAQWLTPDELRAMHHACSSNIADELIIYAEEMIRAEKPRV
jgi:8-oxo-dGTP pyrophosphatase MutT (NUDIX family)